MESSHASSSALRKQLHRLLLLATLLLPSAQRVAADELIEPEDESADLTRFTSSRWAQVYPERDFEGGCVVGFLAFQFYPNGFFTFNNRIRGYWRVDPAGLLRLRTRDNVRFTLSIDGQMLKATANLPFLRRTNVYQKCDD